MALGAARKFTWDELARNGCGDIFASALMGCSTETALARLRQARQRAMKRRDVSGRLAGLRHVAAQQGGMEARKVQAGVVTNSGRKSETDAKGRLAPHGGVHVMGGDPYRYYGERYENFVSSMDTVTGAPKGVLADRD